MDVASIFGSASHPMEALYLAPQNEQHPGLAHGQQWAARTSSSEHPVGFQACGLFGLQLRVQSGTLIPCRTSALSRLKRQ
jgi:hypothetical protein